MCQKDYASIIQHVIIFFCDHFQKTNSRMVFGKNETDSPALTKPTWFKTKLVPALITVCKAQHHNALFLV